MRELGSDSEKVNNAEEFELAFARAKASQNSYVIVMDVDPYEDGPQKDMHGGKLVHLLSQIIRAFLMRTLRLKKVANSKDEVFSDRSRLRSCFGFRVGRAGLDIYQTPVNTKTAEVVQFVSILGGSSANIAVALCQLGKKASLVTCVSDDAVGRYVENQLRRYGVDSHLVRRVSGDFRTSMAVVESTVVDHQSVIYRNNAADFQMHESDLDTLTMSDFAALVVTEHV